jgi:rSAM/selenodomain-associated transferase 1
MSDWLGNSFEYIPQIEGDLGQRMNSAMERAFERGASEVLFLGGDCPYITQNQIENIPHQLQTHDLVIGPAHDGGYYLLALKHPHSPLFENILWGTDQVASQTLNKARHLELSILCMQKLEDVDDLPSWKRATNIVRLSPDRSL